ncbi:MAG: hypothetical protein K2R98_20235, partial [Gemmataceae bacterium]|nr:hypothetical protein [Gemmataceae bacterium]
MARRKPKEQEPRPVRKSLTLDADKLERARKYLNATSDAEVIRLALDHLLSHFEESPEEEEESAGERGVARRA